MPIHEHCEDQNCGLDIPHVHGRRVPVSQHRPFAVAIALLGAVSIVTYIILTSNGTSNLNVPGLPPGTQVNRAKCANCAKLKDANNKANRNNRAPFNTHHVPSYHFVERDGQVLVLDRNFETETYHACRQPNALEWLDTVSTVQANNWRQAQEDAREADSDLASGTGTTATTTTTTSSTSGVHLGATAHTDNTPDVTSPIDPTDPWFERLQNTAFNFVLQYTKKIGKDHFLKEVSVGVSTNLQTGAVNKLKAAAARKLNYDQRRITLFAQGRFGRLDINEEADLRTLVRNHLPETEDTITLFVEIDATPTADDDTTDELLMRIGGDPDDSSELNEDLDMPTTSKYLR